MREHGHPLGKGEVVSSILTGSTRYAPLCRLFALHVLLLIPRGSRGRLPAPKELPVAAHGGAGMSSMMLCVHAGSECDVQPLSQRAHRCVHA
jgi:hypothetical protein